ncbi:hypothetical protein Bca101_013966 [Brassica carinata]
MVLQESNGKDNRGRACLIKTLDDKEWKRIGIASAVSYENESVYILYDAIFFQLSNGEIETSEDGFIDALKNILRKFEELLKSTQLCQDILNKIQEREIGLFCPRNVEGRERMGD